MSQTTATTDFDKQTPLEAHISLVDKLTESFKTQCGTFSDQEDEDIVKFAKDADEFMRLNLTPSLEMGSIVLSNLEGEPYIRAIRWRNSGDFNPEKVRADHWSPQPYQATTPTTREQPAVEANNCLKAYLLCTFPKRIEMYNTEENSTALLPKKPEQVYESDERA